MLESRIPAARLLKVCKQIERNRETERVSGSPKRMVENENRYTCMVSADHSNIYLPKAVSF